MPSHLSTLGKIKGILSLATKGKLAPCAPCEISFRDYEAHSALLTTTGWRKVWSRLSDVWNIMVTKGPVTAAHKGWDYLAQVLTSDLKQGRYDHTIFSDRYIKISDQPMPLQLWFCDEEPEDVDEGVIVCLKVSACQYEIPEYIRDIRHLTDFLEEPIVELKAWRYDFGLEVDTFPGIKGIIKFGTGVSVTRKMWAVNYRLKTAHEMIERFGAEVGYNTQMWDEFRTVYDLMFLRAIYLSGVNPRDVELGITIRQGWPYAMQNCKITAIVGDTVTVISYPDKNMEYDITNPNGLPFEIRDEDEWRTLMIGDVIDAGSPLTSAVKVWDHINKSDLVNVFELDPREKYSKAVVAYNDGIDSINNTIPYNSLIGFFTPGTKVTGSSSGAWGIILADASAAGQGTLYVYGVYGDFICGETVTDTVGGSATCCGLSYESLVGHLIIGDIVEGAASGATGTISSNIEHGSGKGDLVLTLLLGSFINGENIKGVTTGVADVVAGANIEYADYEIDWAESEDFLSDICGFYHDYLVLAHVDYSPTTSDFLTTYALPISPTSIDDFLTTAFLPLSCSTLDLLTDAFVALSEPSGSLLTDFSIYPEAPDDPSMITDGFVTIGAPSVSAVYCTRAGLLEYYDCGTPFTVGDIVTGAVSGATGIISRDYSSGKEGYLLLTIIQDTFEKDEILNDEHAGTAKAATGVIE